MSAQSQAKCALIASNATQESMLLEETYDDNVTQQSKGTNEKKGNTRRNLEDEFVKRPVQKQMTTMLTVNEQLAQACSSRKSSDDTQPLQKVHRMTNNKIKNILSLSVITTIRYSERNIKQ